ncbi:hypothetical protein AB0I22_04275 [Streptomyces sp. NPDC050610]|uniref:hypothetical protein n=1 Tax=Streptomyces sp. NPDC050610 TaxID=3157097 RepID=UPI003424FEF5
MRHTTRGKHVRYGIGTALGVSALAIGALATAPVANAVTTDTATITFECGLFGSGSATLTADHSGTSATISLSTSAITSPIDLAANSVKSTLTMTNHGSGAKTFTGNSNPAIPAGAQVSTGPLKGKVAAGDSLAAKTLKVVVLGVTATCNATSAQSPGPFEF